jgi:hypothetical protein
LQGVGKSARDQEGDYLLSFRGRSAGVAGLGAIDGGEEEAADHAAQVGDARFVDLGQRFQCKAAQVEVGSSLRLILEAVGFGSAQGGACLFFQERVVGSEGGGQSDLLKRAVRQLSVFYIDLSFYAPTIAWCRTGGQTTQGDRLSYFQSFLTTWMTMNPLTAKIAPRISA